VAEVLLELLLPAEPPAPTLLELLAGLVLPPVLVPPLPELPQPLMATPRIPKNSPIRIDVLLCIRRCFLPKAPLQTLARHKLVPKTAGVVPGVVPEVLFCSAGRCYLESAVIAARGPVFPGQPCTTSSSNCRCAAASSRIVCTCNELPANHDFCYAECSNYSDPHPSRADAARCLVIPVTAWPFTLRKGGARYPIGTCSACRRSLDCRYCLRSEERPCFGGRAAQPARRDEGADSTSVTEEQRSRLGWIGHPNVAEILTGGASRQSPVFSCSVFRCKPAEKPPSFREPADYSPPLGDIRDRVWWSPLPCPGPSPGLPC
jgi:hypothetical protein